MNHKTLILSACLAAVSGARASPPSLSSPSTIVDVVNDPSWIALFFRLVPRQDQESTFEERRTFPFRTRPIVLTGVIRIAPDRGLSIDYLTPVPRVLIVDDQGVLMRDNLGHNVPVSAVSGAQASIAAILDVLRFDLADWEREFVVHAIRSGPAWTVAFVPRDRSMAASVGSIVLRGNEGTLEEISLVVSPRQRIDILLHGTRRNVAFDRAALARYFR